MSAMVDRFVGFEREEEGKIDFGGGGQPWMTVNFFLFNFLFFQKNWILIVCV